MILTLTIREDHLEAALDTTGPRLVIADYHELLSGVATLVKKIKHGQALTGILAIIGSVSFTRHRQTITLVNALGATHAIPVATLEYLENTPDEKAIAKAVKKLATAKSFKPLLPKYRAAPTITIKKT